MGELLTLPRNERLIGVLEEAAAGNFITTVSSAISRAPLTDVVMPLRGGQFPQAVWMPAVHETVRRASEGAFNGFRTQAYAASAEVDRTQRALLLNRIHDKGADAAFAEELEKRVEPALSLGTLANVMRECDAPTVPGDQLLVCLERLPFLEKDTIRELNERIREAAIEAVLKGADEPTVTRYGTVLLHTGILAGDKNGLYTFPTAEGGVATAKLPAANLQRLRALQVLAEADNDPARADALEMLVARGDPKAFSLRRMSEMEQSTPNALRESVDRTQAVLQALRDGLLTPNPKKAGTAAAAVTLAAGLVFTSAGTAAASQGVSSGQSGKTAESIVSISSVFGGQSQQVVVAADMGEGSLFGASTAPVRDEKPLLTHEAVEGLKLGAVITEQPASTTQEEPAADAAPKSAAQRVRDAAAMLGVAAGGQEVLKAADEAGAVKPTLAEQNTALASLLSGRITALTEQTKTATLSSDAFASSQGLLARLDAFVQNPGSLDVLTDNEKKAILAGTGTGFEKLLSVQSKAEAQQILAELEKNAAGGDVWTGVTADQQKLILAMLATVDLSVMTPEALAALVPAQPADPAPAQTQAPKTPEQPAPAENQPVVATDLQKALENLKAGADKTMSTQARLTQKLMERGLRYEIAVGFVANMRDENSSFNPSQKQGNGGPAAGLCQWEGPRLAHLKDFAAAKNVAWDTEDIQLDFILEEIKNGGQNWNNYKDAPTPEDAASLILRWYERASDKLPGGKNDADRRGFAAELNKAIQGQLTHTKDEVKPKTEAPATPEGAGGEWHGTLIAVRDNGKITGYKPGEKVPDTWKGQIYYNQHDERWGKDPYQKEGQNNRVLTTSGCGPTSQAMVYSNLLDRSILPKEVAQFNVDNGFRAESGTSHGAFAAGAKYYGLQSKQLDPHSLDQIKRITDAGGYVITNGTDNDPETPGTKGGHIFVIRGVTADGEILVLDPNSFAKTTVAYDPKDIFAASTVAVAIFK